MEITDNIAENVFAFAEMSDSCVENNKKSLAAFILMCTEFFFPITAKLQHIEGAGRMTFCAHGGTYLYSAINCEKQ